MERIIISLSFFWLAIALVFFKEGIHASIVGVALMRRLKKDYYNTWRTLTTIRRSGPGLANPFRFIPWLYRESADYNQDLGVLRLRDSLRTRYRWLTIIFLCLFMSLGLVTIMAFLLHSRANG